MGTNLGADAALYRAKLGTPITLGDLSADTWYYIQSKSPSNSAFGDDLFETSIFKSPTTATMTLVLGDEAIPLTLDEICRSECSFNAEQETVDATTSCDYPYAVTIPTGINTISGEMTTMLRYNDVTKAITPVTLELMNKFFDNVLDNNDGTFDLVTASNDKMLVILDMNRKITTGVGIFKQYLIIPIFVTSFNMSFGLGDPVAPSMSWTKGDGQCTSYTRAII